MDTKKFALATLAGGVTLFVLGYVFYEILLGEFFAANGGSATGVMRDQPIFWAVALGEMGAGALLAIVLGWAGSIGAGGGFKTAAIVGFLVAFAINFIIYGVMNTTNLTAVMVDIPLSAVRYGIAGAVIGILMSRGGSEMGSL